MNHKLKGAINELGKFIFAPTLIRLYDILSIVFISIIANKIVQGPFVETIMLNPFKDSNSLSILYGIFITISLVSIQINLDRRKRITSFQANNTFIRNQLYELNLKKKDDADEKKRVNNSLSFINLYNEQIKIESNPFLYIALWWFLVSAVTLVILMFY